MEMTGEEAVKELQTRYFTTSVIAEATWHLRYIKGGSTVIVKRCVLHYNFSAIGCSSMEGETFEECFEKLDKLNKQINNEIKKNNILLRQFG